jgi:hypothetical protein
MVNNTAWTFLLVFCSLFLRNLTFCTRQKWTMETETKKDIYLLQKCEKIKSTYLWKENCVCQSSQLCQCCVVLPYFTLPVPASHFVPIPSVLLNILFELFTLSTEWYMKEFKYCRYVIPLLECCKVVKHFQDLFFSHFNHEVYFWFHIMITWLCQCVVWQVASRGTCWLHY